MIVVRMPEGIYRASGPIEHGSFQGRWHFPFDRYRDPNYVHFGPLGVFNDDTLSPGAVWPLHPHREIEVVTYCADGEFRHAVERGMGGLLTKGSVQHTTVGRGMWHSEINNRKDIPMRFIQVWFLPSAPGLEPHVEQRSVEEAERTNRFLSLVSPTDSDALFIFSDARVNACDLQKDRTVEYALEPGCGAYLYVLEGGPVRVNNRAVPHLGAVQITREANLRVEAAADAELLLVDVLLL